MKLRQSTPCGTPDRSRLQSMWNAGGSFPRSSEMHWIPLRLGKECPD